MSDPDPDIARLQEHCRQLREHYDSVQIFCTREDTDPVKGGRLGTSRFHSGSGDFYARWGYTKLWVEGELEGIRQQVRDSMKEEHE